ncbi:MAG: MATE family efflux transporter [Bdellovibrionales bacterium]|nr:MATE family efflux transporter [Bdellovibrionales bacterium]
MATGFIVQAVDSTMVAPMGSAALAALGVAGAASFIPNSFTMGLITSVQKRVAASENIEDRSRALTANMILGMILALPFSALFFIFAKQIAGFYTRGEAVELAADFIRFFCPSFIFSSMSQAVNGYWIGALKSKTRLSITVAVTVMNVLGNLVLAPRYGLPGVAVSSAIAITGGFGLNIYLTMRFEGFRFRVFRISEVLEDLKVVFGVSLHQMSLALTLNAAVALVGLIGVEALAVANVVGTLSLPALYLGIGYGVATGSFLIKALAKNDRQVARHIAMLAFKQVAAISVALAFAILIFSAPIRHWFFKDPVTFDLARTPFVLLALLVVIDGVGCAIQRFHFVSDGLRQSFTIMTAVQWGLFIPLAFAAVKFGGISYPGYLTLHVGQRLLIGLLLYWAWRRRLERV